MRVLGDPARRYRNPLIWCTVWSAPGEAISSGAPRPPVTPASRTLRTMLHGPTEGLTRDEASDLLWRAYVQILIDPCPDDEDDDSYDALDASNAVWAWIRSVPLDSEWGPAFVTRQIERLGERFDESDARIRNRIQTALVEHLLEDEAYEGSFDSWRSDPARSMAFQAALRFGRSMRSRGLFSPV